MPELPEVETVARTLRPRLVGRRVLSVATSGKKLRAPIDKQAITRAAKGATIDVVRRHAKYLVVELSSARVLLVHLGMTGRLTIVQASAPHAPHTHVVLGLEGGEELRYVDPRRFGAIAVYRAADLARAPELTVLGPDPLSDAFTLEQFRAELRSSDRDLKQFLMDQSRVAGLGNIYVCEALYRARISPRKRASSLSGSRAELLRTHIREILEQAIAHRGTTFRNYVDGGGEPGGNQMNLDVYGRQGEPCRACGSPIGRIVQGARSTFFCRRCQK